MDIWARKVVFFPFLGEIVDSFSNFLFHIFWKSINLVYVLRLGEEYLVYHYLFISQREFHSVPDMDFFAIPSFILSYFELSKIELPKLISSILMEIENIPGANSILICTSPKGLAFWKSIFELDYHWASLSLHFHVFLK